LGAELALRQGFQPALKFRGVELKSRAYPLMSRGMISSAGAAGWMHARISSFGHSQVRILKKKNFRARERAFVQSILAREVRRLQDLKSWRIRMPLKTKAPRVLSGRLDRPGRQLAVGCMILGSVTERLPIRST